MRVEPAPVGGGSAQSEPSAPAREYERVLTRREKIWNFVEDNTALNTFILLVIVLSTICFVLETEITDPELKEMWFWCAAAPAPPPPRAAAATHAAATDVVRPRAAPSQV